VFDNVSNYVNFVTIGGEGQAIMRFFRKFSDIKYQVKFRETLEKFAYLMRNINSE
jgi:hypothetical protein